MQSPEALPQAVTHPAVVTDSSAAIGFTEADPTGPPPATPADPDKPELLAGKYASTEELVKAYQELEAKLGKPEPPEDPKPDVPPVPEQEKVAALTVTDEATALLQEKGLDIRDFVAEYERTGQLSEAAYAALEAKGIGRDMVDAYTQGQRALLQSQVQEVQNSVGGEAAYQAMAAWAQANLSPQEQSAYQRILDTQDPEGIKLAAQGVKARYEAAQGREPSTVLSGHAPGRSDGPAGFASRAQMIEAMRDPRYEKDPAYRAKVEQMVIHSEL